MDVTSRFADIGTERALFALGAIFSGALTVLVFMNGTDEQGALYAAFSLYLGGAATPSIYGVVPDYRRTGAIALAAIGVVALVAGIQSALPVLFIIGGIAALLGLF